AVAGGHAAERPLVDLALLSAREGQAIVLKLVDGGGRLAAEILDRVLVAEPVGAFDRVVHVPAPVVLAHIAELGGYAALGRTRVRARRKPLGDAGRLQASLAAAQRRAQAGAAGTDHHDAIGVVGGRIGAPVDPGPAAIAVRSVRHVSLRRQVSRA